MERDGIMVKILAFAGSGRIDSFNKKLVGIAVSNLEDSASQVTYIDLSDYPMPLFNQDLEASEGMPEKAREFKTLLIEHSGFLIASPEYNGFFSPLLKNALDWASRAEPDDEYPLSAFKGKSAALMAASPGGYGGMRGLVYLRLLLNNLGVLVLPDQVVVPNASEAFDDKGLLKDPKIHSAVSKQGIKLLEFCSRQAAGLD